ncbi:MAG: hypothetical protein V2I33_15925 [Kangiellaceae bacterium]|jgi:hypothetical protein|nr:hypothetical protein [Kangiellaceae bacterium]
MMNPLRVVAAVSIFFFTIGCSHQGFVVSDKDWYQIGFLEGKNLYHKDWRETYHKLNGEQPLSFDKEAYDKGFSAGRESVKATTTSNSVATK